MISLMVLSTFNVSVKVVNFDKNLLPKTSKYIFTTFLSKYPVKMPRNKLELSR